jgi:hypothetical protein
LLSERFGGWLLGAFGVLVKRVGLVVVVGMAGVLC